MSRVIFGFTFRSDYIMPHDDITFGYWCKPRIVKVKSSEREMLGSNVWHWCWKAGWARDA